MWILGSRPHGSRTSVPALQVVLITEALGALPRHPLFVSAFEMTRMSGKVWLMCLTSFDMTVADMVNPSQHLLSLTKMGLPTLFIVQLSSA